MGSTQSELIVFVLILQTISKPPSSALEAHLNHTVLDLSDQILTLNKLMDQLKANCKVNNTPIEGKRRYYLILRMDQNDSVLEKLSAVLFSRSQYFRARDIRSKEKRGRDVWRHRIRQSQPSRNF